MNIKKDDEVKITNKQKLKLGILGIVILISAIITYNYERDILKTFVLLTPWVIVIRLYYENYKLKQEIKSYRK